jgi:hypothetical protein
MRSIPERVRAALTEYAGEGGDWHGNWPLNSPRALGERGRFNGDSFVFGGQSALSFSSDPVRILRDAWEYLDADGSSVELGGDASAPGWEFLGPAKAGLRAQFARSESVYLSVSASYIDRVADVDDVKQALRAAHETGQYSIGTAVVVERLVADKTLLLASRSANSTLNATVAGDVSGTGSTASLAGHLKVIGSHSGVDMEQFGNGPVVLAFRSVILVRRGWLWWRRIEAAGLQPLDGARSLALLEELAEPADYFVQPTKT